MLIGDYQSLMLRTLKALADRAELPLGEIRERIAVSEKLTDREVSENCQAVGRPCWRSGWVGRSACNAPGWWNVFAAPYAG